LISATGDVAPLLSLWSSDPARLVEEPRGFFISSQGITKLPDRSDIEVIGESGLVCGELWEESDESRDMPWSGDGRLAVSDAVELLFPMLGVADVGIDSVVDPTSAAYKISSRVESACTSSVCKIEPHLESSQRGTA
jgi:hypothetical protein